MYGQVEHFALPERIISHIKMPVPKQPSKVAIVDWTAHDTVDDAKAWCVAELIKRRLQQ